MKEFWNKITVVWWSVNPDLKLLFKESIKPLLVGVIIGLVLLVPLLSI